MANAPYTSIIAACLSPLSRWLYGRCQKDVPDRTHPQPTTSDAVTDTQRTYAVKVFRGPSECYTTLRHGGDTSRGLGSTPDAPPCSPTAQFTGDWIVYSVMRGSGVTREAAIRKLVKLLLTEYQAFRRRGIVSLADPRVSDGTRVLWGLISANIAVVSALSNDEAEALLWFMGRRAWQANALECFKSISLSGGNCPGNQSGTTRYQQLYEAPAKGSAGSHQSARDTRKPRQYRIPRRQS